MSADDLRYNVEAYHEGWLAGYEKLARQYFDSACKGKTEDALLLVFCPPDVPLSQVEPEVEEDDDDDEDEENDDEGLEAWDVKFECLRSFKLPAGASNLIMAMARFSLAGLMPPDKVDKCPFEIREFPRTTFLMSALLEAGFPRNVHNGTFRGHDGGILVGYESLAELASDAGMERSLHVIFAGLGVTLMRECRATMDPWLSDAEVIDRAENIYLSIFEEKP